jgi:HEPN domain-containing protein
MPPPRSEPGSASDWLSRARADLALARVNLPEGGRYEDLCFHAQQAAEKALKSVYRHRGWTFRHVHDVEELITGLLSRGMEVPDPVRSAIVLTSYASEVRYPGLYEPVQERDRDEAVKMAEAVVMWAADMTCTT